VTLTFSPLGGSWWCSYQTTGKRAPTWAGEEKEEGVSSSRKKWIDERKLNLYTKVRSGGGRTGTLFTKT